MKGGARSHKRMQEGHGNVEISVQAPHVSRPEGPSRKARVPVSVLTRPPDPLKVSAGQNTVSVTFWLWEQ